IPYKVSIIPFLDDLDETARVIGAVNAIKISRINGVIHTKGFNADAPGFELTLTEISIGCKALILGTGGASKAVAFALEKKEIPYTFVSRKPGEGKTISYNKLNQDIIGENLLIINTTPLGMYPETNYFPDIPYQYLTQAHFLYDLIYNPPETAFLQKGRLMGAQTMNGYQMLENQANLAYGIFTE
ncbi:MAG: shikimate dehydrogenase, partial [Bacteroidetes bacterium]|nr:shikimate dehydrogenase [Bacteroidota bacterium]